MRIVDRLEQETEGSLKFLDDGFGKDEEFNIGRIVIDVLGKFGNAFCVRLRLELEALAFEKDFEFFIVCDDAIVDNRELPG